MAAAANSSGNRVRFARIECRLSGHTSAWTLVETAKSNGCADFIAHAGVQSHYLQFRQHYLGGFKEGVSVPYSSSEHILATFAQTGLAVESKDIRYSNDRRALSPLPFHPARKKQKR